MRSGIDGGPKNPSVSVLKAVWTILCVPAYAVLLLLEPFVRVVFSGLAVLGIATSVAFKFLQPEFPFWTMMATSLSFLVALVLYYCLMRIVRPQISNSAKR